MSMFTRKKATSKQTDRPASDEELKDWLREHPDQVRFKKAIGFLYQSEYKRVMHVLKRYGGTEPEAQEVFQDALMVLARNINAIDIKKSIASYLMGICVKRHISKSRKKSLDVVSADATYIPELKVVDADLEQMYIRLERDKGPVQLIDLLRQLMQKLNENCQKVLSLRYFDEISVKDIAAQDNINAQSVSNKIFRCINRLREIIKGYPELEELLRAKL